METVLGYVGIFIAVAGILSLLPITKEIIRPILSGLGEVIVWLVKETWGWLIFCFKAIYNAHSDFFNHLTSARSNFVIGEKLDQIKKSRRR